MVREELDGSDNHVLAAGAAATSLDANQIRTEPGLVGTFGKALKCQNPTRAIDAAPCRNGAPQVAPRPIAKATDRSRSASKSARRGVNASIFSSGERRATTINLR